MHKRNVYCKISLTFIFKFAIRFNQIEKCKKITDIKMN